MENLAEMVFSINIGKYIAIMGGYYNVLFNYESGKVYKYSMNK